MPKHATLNTAGHLPVDQLASGTPSGVKYLKDDGTWTNPSPDLSATSMLYANGQSFEAWKAAVETILAGVSPSAPVNTVAPTAPTGSLSVGSTLTANQGTWTGASTFAYQWRRTGVTISGATASTYVLTIADTGFYLTCTVAATATNGLVSSATSPAVGPVTATLPTNTVAPAVTPSGTQLVNTLLTTTDGTWNNGGGATYTYQWFFNGTPIPFATVNTFTPVTSHIGGTVYVKVWATTGQGTSAAGAQSNSITVSGAPAVVNTAVPAWSGTVQLTVANDFTEGTWTGSITATRNWSFFRNSETTPYVTPPNTVSIHTPRAPAVAGDTLYIEETVFDSSTSASYTARSAGATVVAAPPALVALPALLYPVWGAVTPQASTQFNPADTLTFGGTVRLQQVADPGGSGRSVYIHRVVKADAGVSAGTSTVTTRAEKQYIYNADAQFWPGTDYWFCFAIRANEYPTSNEGVVANNVHLVWQTHTQGNGDTQPPMSLIHDIGHNTRYWRRSWNHFAENTWVSNGGANPDTEGFQDVTIGTFPTIGVWYKYIVHYRSGWTTGHAPKMEVWEAIANNTYTKVVEKIATTDFNDYNAVNGSYNRIGPYKWSGTHWHATQSAVSMYATEIYSRNNTGATSYFNECVFTLTGL